MNIEFMITSFVTLFVIVDPIGLTPLFIALTDGMSNDQRRKTALRAIATSAVILTAFILVGDALLTGIGITIPAFRIAGGVLLFLTALDMLFERRTKRRENQSEEDKDRDDPSIFPMAIPLIAGPGSITTVILIASQHEGYVGLLESFVVMVACLATLAVFLFSSSWIARLLGPTAINVVTRILGLLLAALSIQFVADGIFAFIDLHS